MEHSQSEPSLLPDGEIIIPLSGFWLGDFPPTRVYLEPSTLSHGHSQHKCYNQEGLLHVSIRNSKYVSSSSSVNVVYWMNRSQPVCSSQGGPALRFHSCKRRGEHI